MFKIKFSKFFLIFIFQCFIINGLYALECDKVIYKVTNTSLIYCVDQDVTLQTEVTDFDGGTISYKWFSPTSNTALPNETNSFLKILKVAKNKSGIYKCEITVEKGAVKCTKTIEIDLDVIDKFTLSLGGDQSICPSKTTIDLKPTLTKTPSTISYEWSSSANTNKTFNKDTTISKNNFTNQVTLTLEAKSGNCSVKDNIVISNLTNFKVDAGADKFICSGDAVTLVANISDNQNLAAIYNWTGPNNFKSTNKTITLPKVLKKSEYTVNATAGGCTVQDKVLINIPDFEISSPFFNPDQSQLVYCLQQEETFGSIGFNFILPSNTSSIDAITLDWGDGTDLYTVPRNDYGSMQIHDYQPGSYKLDMSMKLKDGCVVPLQYTVFVGSSPSPAALLLFINQANGCSPHITDYNFEVPIKNVNGTQYIVNWGDSSPLDTFIHPNVPKTLSHTYIESSCGKSVTIAGVTYTNVYQPSVITQNPCSVQPQPSAAALISVGTPPKPIFEVSKPLICIEEPVNIISNSDFGMTIVPGSSSCSLTAPFYWEIKKVSDPSSKTWSLLSGTLGSSNGKTNQLLWTLGSQNLSVKFPDPGTYSITLYIKNSCGLRLLEKFVNVESKPIPKFVFVDDKNKGCLDFETSVDNTSILTNTINVTRLWSIEHIKDDCTIESNNPSFIFTNNTNATSEEPKFKFLKSGTFKITLALTNSCGTFTYVQEVYVYSPPVVSISLPESICQGYDLTPTSSVNSCNSQVNSYSWIINGATPSTSTLKDPGVIKYLTDGTYNVQFSATNACGTSNIATSSIRVKITPKVSTNQDFTICSEELLNIPIVSTPNNIQTSYTWKAIDNTNVSNETLNLQNTSLINDRLVNNTNSTQIVNYVITPTSIENCTGPEKTIIVNLKAKPRITINPPSTEICKNSSIDLEAFGETSNTPANWKFTWTPTTNITPTVGSKVRVSPLETTTYTVKGEDGSCSNTSSVTVTVKELPVINNSPASQTICSETATASVTWSSTMSSSYTWSISSNPGNITGATASGSGNLPAMTLTNPTFVNQTLKYTVTPRSNSCDGPTFEYSIIVKPKPNLTISPFTKTTYCGGEQITVPTFTSSVTGATFQWNLTTPSPLPAIITGIPNNHNGNGQMTNLTINNSGTDPVTFTYTIKSIANECDGNPSTFSFTIFPAPSIQPLSKSSQEICSETSTEAIPFSSLTANVKYIWKFSTIPTGLSVPSKLADSITGATSFSIPSFPFTNGTANPISVDVIVKAATSGAATCPGQTRTHTITINPKPIVAPSTVSQLICNTQNTTAINFSSTTNLNMSYSWVNSNTSIGLAAIGTGNIASFAATNGTKDVKVATITVTPVYSTANKTCNGVPSDAVIKVLPTPEVNAITSQVKCPAENTDAVTPVINPATGSTYSWALTGEKPNASSAMSGTGSISSVVAENSGSTIKIGTYTVTPTFTFEGKACAGSGLPFTISVLPKPVLNPITSQEKCSNTQNDVVTFTTVPATGVVINWQNDLNIGIPTSGTGNIPASTLTNATTAPITSNFTASPSFTNSGKTCNGDNKTFSIKVNPIPTVNPVADISICPGFNQAAIPFTSPVAGTTYAWSSTGDPVGLSGTSGSGNLPAFTSVNTADVIKTATIQVTPTASTCPGPAISFRINVKPKPRITNTPLSQEVCSGDKNRPVVWTSSVTSPVPTYSWTSSPLTSGLTITPATGTGNIPDSYQFVNTGTSPISVKFTVTATVASCESTPTDYTLTVNPRPVLSDVASQVICSGSSFTTPTFTSNITPNTTYTWAVKTTPPISPNLTGYTATGTGSITGVVLTNADNSPQNLVYTITPTAYTCAGLTKDFTIQVNPTPMVTFSIPNQTICNTTTTQAVNITPIPSDATYSWNATVPAAISGFTTITGTGAIPASVLTSNSTSPSEITIQARASTTGTAVCPGITREHKITVIPTPVVTATNDQTVCTGNTVNAVTFTGTATRFDWTNSTTTLGLTAASGSASVPQFTASNTGVAPTNTTIRVTPKYELNTVLCTGNPDEYVITVNPRPVLNNLTELTRCNRENFTEQTFTSNIPSTTYTWTNSNTAIGLAQNGTVSIPTFVATNSTNATLTGNVVVTPTFTNNTIACNGDTKNVNYIVKPTARVSNLDTKDSICSGEFSKAVQWSTNITAAGTTYTWKLINTPDSVEGHQLNGTGNLFYAKVYNKAKTIRSLVYKVSPTYSGCLGDTSFLYTLYINPAPGLSGVVDQTICGGTSTVQSTFVSDVAGTVFNWVLRNKSSLPSTVTGYVGSTTPNGTGNLAATVINNAGSNPVDLLYDISTNGSTGCGGSSQQLKITVNPAPILNPIAAQTICSGQTTTAITLVSSTAGVSFKWDVISGSENLTGLNTMSGLTNSIPAYTLSHTTPNIQVVKILAFAKTAGAAVCDGRKDTIKITVNPIPVLSDIASQEICSGASFTTPTFTSTVVGNTNYSWTLKTTPPVSGKLTGYTAAGTGVITGVRVENSDSIPQTVTYIVTPTSYTCNGGTKEFLVTVNPVTKVRFSLPDQTICNDATSQRITIKPEPINATIIWNATVPTAITGFTSLTGTNEIPAYRLTNGSNLPAEISVVATASTVGRAICPGTPSTYKISVIPTPTVTPTNDLTVCTGNQVNAVTFTGTATKFEWTNSFTTLGLTPASGEATVPQFTASNSGTTPTKTTIKVTPKYALNTVVCSGNSDEYEITVNPRPVLNNLTALSNCNRQNFLEQTFTGNIPSATYSWTNSNIAIGLAQSGTGSIPLFQATNNTDAILTANIVVTPTFTNNTVACNGETKNVNYVVKPTASVTNPDRRDSICSGEFSKGIDWITNITAAGTTYTWKLINSPDSVSGYDLTGTGKFFEKKITNKAKTIRSLEYRVSPTYSDCLGDTSFIYTLYINPAPGLKGVVDQTICGGTSTAASVFISDVVGTTFRWQLTNKASLPNTISGYAGSTVANGTGNIPASLITNTGSAPIDLLYDVATNSSSGCSGASQELKITVNPSPILNPVSAQTICSGQNTNAINLASSTLGVTFKWDVVSGATNVTGVNTLNGTINTIPSYTISHDKLTKQTVKILAFAKTSGLAVCDGKKDTLYLHINPIPALSNISDIVVCKDELTPEVVFNGNGTNYKWTVTNAAIGLSAGNGLRIPAFNGINATVAPVASTVSVVPEFTDVVTCLGSPKSFLITVNPKPNATSLSNVVVCHNENVSIPAFTSTTTGVVYKWSNNLTSINLGANGVGDIPTFKASNTSTSASTLAKIKVVPFFTNLAKECKGDTMPFTIKVNPIPVINRPTDIVLCNDSLTPRVTFTGTATSYDWYNKNINIGLAAQGTGNIEKFKSINASALPVISEVKVVPVFTEDLKSCKGDTAKFTIKVNPTPLLTIPPFDTLCYDQNTKRVEFSSNILNSSFSWINTTPTIASGLGASGTNPINSFKGTNSSHVQQVSIAEVTTTADGCPSKKGYYKIVINPKARIIDVPTNQEICSGVKSAVVDWKSDVVGTVTTYDWILKSNPYKVALTNTSGTGSLPPISMINDSSRTAEVVFSIIPKAYGCVGDTFLYTYKVLPRPKVKLIPAQTICGGSAYTAPVFSSDVSNTIFTWKLRDSLLVPPTITGYVKSGVNVLPSRTIENTGTKLYELNYDVTTSGAGCSGQSIEFKLTVKPAPKVTFDLKKQTICNADNTKEVVISTVTPDAFFEWSTVSTPDSLFGVNVTTGTNKIGIYTLTNTSTKPIDLNFKAKAYTIAGTQSCYGVDSIYTITVNPVAKAKDVVEQKVCHGLNTTEIVIPGTGTSYNWFTNETAVGLNPTSGVNKIPVFTVNQPDTSLTKKIEFYVQPKYTHQGVTCDGTKDTIHMTLYPKPIIDVKSATICLGKKATLKGEGAASNAKYLWSPATGLSCTDCLSSVASPTSTTEYTVIGINRFGCKDTTKTTVFVNPLPKVYAGPDTTLCRQPIPHTMVGMAEGVVKPGFWSGSSDLTVDGIYTPTKNGVFNVVYQYILPTGCENFDTTIVTVKDVTKADAGPDLIACFNDPDVTLNGMPKPGTWTGFNVSTEGIFKPIKDTTVNLVYTIGKGTCLNRDTMSFLVHPDYLITAGPDKEFCFSDQPFDFINQDYEPKTPQVNGEWTGKGIIDKTKGTFHARVAGEGKHEIVFTYTHPVTGCVKYDTLIAEVHPLPVVQFKIDSIVCLNSTHTILNNTKYLQSSDWTIAPKWKYVDKNPTHKFDSVGFVDIRLIATSPFGCIDSLSKTIEVREAPVAKFTRTPDSTCGLVSFVNSSTGIGVTYAWDFGNGVKYDQRDPADLIYKPGIVKDTTYTIRLRIENMCGVDTMSKPIVVKPVPKIVFSPNLNEGCSVLPIVYANKTVGLPDELKWDFFGDGNFVETKDSLIYKNYTTGPLSSTTYNVKVIAVNECGSDTATTTILVHPNTVKAHFNPDKIEGCTDLGVKFTQYSMGHTFHVWNFGDGTTSKDLHPTHIYKNGGDYTVYLAVTNGCSKDTMRANIRVYKTPTIDFTKSKDSLCLKNTFVFNSIKLPSAKLSYKWYFGDGDSSILENTQHSYKAAGEYEVKLKVTNVDNYCGAEKAYKVYVKPRPVANFVMDTTKGCSPILVKFTNKSIGANFNAWNFGDGTLSNGTDVTHTFKTSLKDTLYNVRLIVENSSSCKDTFTSKVHVYPLPIIKYSYTPSDQCYTPMYADFTNQSIGALSYKWFFHDGITSVELNPRMQYELAGKYQVKLVGTNEFGCQDSVTHEVVKFPKPKAGFSIDTNAACIPATFNFTNSSVGASKYYWDFGNGDAKNTKDVSYLYSKDGKYDVRLIVENSDKCKDTMILPVTAHPIPNTDFIFKSTDSCYSPMITNFTNKTTGALFYEWDFKNGLVSSFTNPSTTFVNAGNYVVSLKATNEFSCSIVKEKVVTLLQKPKANFKVDVDQGCIPLVVTFTNESEYADYFSWNFADGNITSQKDTKNMFRTSGVDEKKEFLVNLVVEGQNGCKDTIEKTITTFPLPKSAFKYTTTDPCFNPMLSTFENLSEYGKKYLWRFGDGTTSTLTNPNVSYTKADAYKVDLITTNKFNCNDTATKVIKMLQKPDAQFAMDKLNGCIPLSVNFTNNSAFNTLNYWNFDDGNTSVEFSPNHVFTKVGEMNIQLITESTDKCKDTVYKKITTYPLPVPDFTFTTTDPCYIPMNATMKNTSTGATGYRWNFGNGNSSTWINPVEKYTASGTYKVTLEAINEYQCTAEKTDNVTVKNIPIANFNSDYLDGCMPLNVNFYNLSSGFKYSSWDFGDSNSSNDIDGKHTFTKDGIFTIRLISENVEGCTDTINKTITVYPLPHASFGYTNTDPCYSPMIVQMTNKSQGAIGYDWQFTNGQTSTLTHPTTSFTEGGNHLLSLIAKNEFGCKDDTSAVVISYNPPKIKSAQFSDEECQYDQSRFRVEGDYISKYTWDMGDGVRQEGQSFNYAFTKDGIFTITVYAEGEGSCKDTLVVNKKIKIKKDPRADFEAINILIDGKKNGTIEFDNKSRYANKYFWDFGDGDTSTSTAPIHKYYNSGNYHTTLITYNQFNCVDTMEMDIHVDFFKGLHVPNAMYIGHQDYEVSHFLPKGVGLYQYEISIYDDWGNLIWRSNAIDEFGRPSEAWDGKYNGEYVQQDSYVWKVDAIFKDDSVWQGKEYQPTVYKRSGTVTVIK